MRTIQHLNESYFKVFTNVTNNTACKKLKYMNKVNKKDKLKYEIVFI